MNDLNRYIELAKICKATYKGPINHKILTYKNESIEEQKIIHGSFGRGFCRLFWNTNTVIISFRGTRESVDWLISNFKLIPVNLKTETQKTSKIKVHKGFQETLLKYTDKTTNIKSIEALWKHISDYNLFNGRKIVITGHSLGGALATLFVVKLREKYRNYTKQHLQEIVIFGSPSVGLRNFKKHYFELNSKTLRIVNGSDIVPFTPPLFYYHIGSELWLNRKSTKENVGWFQRLAYAIRLPLKKFMIDHEIQAYIENLIKHNIN